MYKVRLSNVLVVVITLTFLFIVLTSSQAGNIYKWTDEKGTIHLTNDPDNVPLEKKEDVVVIKRKEGSDADGIVEFEATPAAPSETQNPDQELEQQKQEQEKALREFWNNRVLEIESRERAVIEQIEIAERNMEYKKREVEYLLINGYFADHSIFELRYLENFLNDLENQLISIGQEKENLKREARREGIPPGYLRP